MNRRRFFTRLVGASVALTTAARLSLEPAAEVVSRKVLSLEEFLRIEAQRISETVEAAWKDRLYRGYVTAAVGEKEAKKFLPERKMPDDPT